MIRLNYKYKLLLSFTAIFSVFTALLVIFEMNHENKHSVNLLQERLRCYANITAEIINNSKKEDIKSNINGLLTTIPDKDIRLTILSHEGNVVFESYGNAPKYMNSHADRPEIIKALKDYESYDIRESATTKLKYFYYAKSYTDFIVRMALPFNISTRNFLHPSNVFLWFVLILFPIVIVMLIYLSDRMGKSVSKLRSFINGAELGQVKYEDIQFPQSELGEIGSKILKAYKQIEEKGHQARMSWERLLKHFQYFEGGIAIFNSRREVIYANPRFTQYVNTILPAPTGNLKTIWENKDFKPALQFVELNSVSTGRNPEEAAPVTRFTINAGSSHFGVQVLMYSDGDFEMTLYDATRAEKNRLLKQQMSNNITHELRTPVSCIRGYVETIIQNQNLTDEKKLYFLKRTHSQVLRLTELIHDVSIITKVEEAPETMDKETIYPAEIMEDILEELRPSIEENNMKTECAIDKGIEVYGNYSLVYSIFRNLTENSVRYAGHGTTIHAECYKSGEDFNYFVFYDTGKGCPEEHLHRLFERFYRAEEGRTRESGGSGLGLSIVRNAVTFHKGDISVRNRKGGGLEFLFTLQKKAI